RTVAVEDEHAQVRPRQCEAQADRRGAPHTAPGVEVLRSIAGGIQIVRGMAEARDDRRSVRDLNNDAGRFDAVHGDVIRRGRRHAWMARVANAVRPAIRTAISAAASESTDECCTPIASSTAPRARPIGACAAFHSPTSPRMLTTISAGT